MKIVLSAAVLGSALAPAFSLSYLESLGGSAPKFAATPANGASYLDALRSSGNAPTGAGITSYLDALPTQPSNLGGGGLNTYTDNLNRGAPAFVPPVAAAPEPAAAAPAPAAPAAPTSSSAPAATGGNYMEALAASSSAGAPTGAGITGYLDALPKGASGMSGAGIRTYTDNLPITNTVTGTGSGMNTYTDALGGGKSTFSKSFAPSGSGYKMPAKPSFSGSVGGSDIDFTLEASDLSALISQLQGSGGTIRLTGSVTGVSFN